MQKIFAVLLFFFCLAAGLQEAEARIYIDISNPNIRRIPVAMPWFTPLDGAHENAAAAAGTDILAKNLGFTGTGYSV